MTSKETTVTDILYHNFSSNSDEYVSVSSGQTVRRLARNLLKLSGYVELVTLIILVRNYSMRDSIFIKIQAKYYQCILCPFDYYA